MSTKYRYQRPVITKKNKMSNGKTEDKLEDRLEKMAENSAIKLLSRVMLIVALPFSGWFGAEAWETLKTMSRAQTEIQKEVVELSTLIAKGLEPRVRFLEQEIFDMRGEVRERSLKRFDKEDALRQKEAIDRRLDKLDAAIEEIRKDLRTTR